MSKIAFSSPPAPAGPAGGQAQAAKVKDPLLEKQKRLAEQRRAGLAGAQGSPGQAGDAGTVRPAPQVQPQAQVPPAGQPGGLPVQGAASGAGALPLPQPPAVPALDGRGPQGMPEAKEAAASAPVAGRVGPQAAAAVPVPMPAVQKPVPVPPSVPGAAGPAADLPDPMREVKAPGPVAGQEAALASAAPARSPAMQEPPVPAGMPADGGVAVPGHQTSFYDGLKDRQPEAGERLPEAGERLPEAERQRLDDEVQTLEQAARARLNRGGAETPLKGQDYEALMKQDPEFVKKLRSAQQKRERDDYLLRRERQAKSAPAVAAQRLPQEERLALNGELRSLTQEGRKRLQEKLKRDLLAAHHDRTGADAARTKKRQEDLKLETPLTAADMRDLAAADPDFARKLRTVQQKAARDDLLLKEEREPAAKAPKQEVAVKAPQEHLAMETRRVGQEEPPRTEPKPGPGPDAGPGPKTEGAGTDAGTGTNADANASANAHPKTSVTTIPTHSLAKEDRQALDGEMKALKQEVRQSLAESLRQKATTPEERERADLLEMGSTLTQEDRVELRRLNPALARKLQAAEVRVYHDDRLRKAERQEQGRQRLAEQDRNQLRQDPARWAEGQKNRVAAMAQESLPEYIQTQTREVKERTQELQQMRGAYQQEEAALTKEFENLEARNRERLRQDGHTPPEQGVGAWHPDLMDEAEAFQSKFSALQDRMLDFKEAEGRLVGEINTRIAPLNQAQERMGVAQEAERVKSQENLRYQGTPGAERMLEEMETLRQGQKAAVEKLKEEHPEGIPPEKIQALQKEAEAGQQAMMGRVEQRMQAAQTAHANLQKGLSATKDLSEAEAARVMAEQREAEVQDLARTTGLPEQEARQLLEDTEAQDWSIYRPGEKKPGFFGSDERETRLQSNGAILVHPRLAADPQAYRDAVKRSGGSPEAIRAALEMQPQAHRQWAAQMADTLVSEQDIPGLPSFNKWREERVREDQDARGATGFTKMDLPDMALLYMKEMKDRPGWQKYADTFTRRLVSAGGGVGASALGLAAMAAEYSGVKELTGFDAGQALAGAAADWTRSNQSISGSLELKGGLDSAGLKATGILADVIPQLGATFMGGGVLKAGKFGKWLSTTGVGAAQSGGQTFAQVYTGLMDQGVSHEEAMKTTTKTALATGAATAALGVIADKAGAVAMNNLGKALSRPGVLTAVTDTWKQQFKNLAARSGMAGLDLGKELAEETADNLASEIAQAYFLNPEIKLDEAIASAINQMPEVMTAVAEMSAMTKGAGRGRGRGHSGPPGADPAAQPPASPALPAPDIASMAQPEMNAAQATLPPPASGPTPAQAQGQATAAMPSPGPVQATAPDQPQAAQTPAMQTMESGLKAGFQQDRATTSSPLPDSRQTPALQTMAASLSTEGRPLPSTDLPATDLQATPLPPGSGTRTDTTANTPTNLTTNLTTNPATGLAAPARVPDLPTAQAPVTNTPQTPPLFRRETPVGGGIDIVARLPDGRFQARALGRDFPLTLPQAAQVSGLSPQAFESRMAQATRDSLAAPRQAGGAARYAPPIWQGTGTNGDPVEVLSRNPDGSFQVRFGGQEKTRSEADVAFMTGLRKGPLDAMLAKATEGWLQSPSTGTSDIQNPPWGSLKAPSQQETGSVYANIPPPDGRPSIQEWVDPKDVTYWDQRLADARVRDPVDYTEVLGNSDANLGPLNRLQVHRAMQSFLNLIPGDIVRAIGPFDLYSYRTILDESGKPVNARGQWTPGNAGQVKDPRYKHGPHIRLTHDLASSEYQLRSTLWHEMTHWLWDNADKHPRLKKWRHDLEQHFAERTAGEELLWDREGGYYYWKDGWIEKYSGRHYPGRTPGVELPTTYMQLLSGGGAGVAKWQIHTDAISTFELVMSILGDTK